MSNLSPRALALSQAHGPGPVDWEKLALVVEGMIIAEKVRIIEAVERPGEVP